MILKQGFDGFLVSIPKCELLFNAIMYLQCSREENGKTVFDTFGYCKEEGSINGLTYICTGEHLVLSDNCDNIYFDNFEALCRWYIAKQDMKKEVITNFHKSVEKAMKEWPCEHAGTNTPPPPPNKPSVGNKKKGFGDNFTVLSNEKTLRPEPPKPQFNSKEFKPKDNFIYNGEKYVPLKTTRRQQLQDVITYFEKASKVDKLCQQPATTYTDLITAKDDLEDWLNEEI